MNYEQINNWFKNIFDIKNVDDFNKLAIKAFQIQFENNTVYKNFCTLLNKNPSNVKEIYDIPFLPTITWKKNRITSFSEKEKIIFTSSGTTSVNCSSHYIRFPEFYEMSVLKCFEHFFGNIEDYIIIGLVPDEKKDASSLLFMMNYLIKKSNNIISNNYYKKIDKLFYLFKNYSHYKFWILGTSSYLLTELEQSLFHLPNAYVLHTGGNKGFSVKGLPEPDFSEINEKLTKIFPLSSIGSEYGMCELFSQAYSLKFPYFKTPPWMKIILRDIDNPLKVSHKIKKGIINIIDLANIDTCCFIATDDIGEIINDNNFTIYGRLKNSDIRGCSLL